MGNKWSFYYEKEDELNFDFKFKLIDANGNEHIGKYYTGVEDVQECSEKICFCFEDFSTDYYKFISYNGEKFEFDNNGVSFVLTRK